MMYFKQKIDNQFSKPIRINLLFGNFQLISHDSNTIEIEGKLNRTFLVSTIKDEGSYITIHGQKLLSIISTRSPELILIKVPHQSTVYFKKLLGNLTIGGFYKSVEVEIGIGKVSIDFNKFQVSTYSYLELFSGKIELINLPEKTNLINQKSLKRNYKFINGSTLHTRLKLGSLSLN